MLSCSYLTAVQVLPAKAMFISFWGGEGEVGPYLRRFGLPMPYRTGYLQVIILFETTMGKPLCVK